MDGRICSFILGVITVIGSIFVAPILRLKSPLTCIKGGLSLAYPDGKKIFKEKIAE
ncbi:MAG: hypothetical protein FWC41_02320 [Firmicutes bacterium]|nr:hypothetical protein [Bacillota bacterium]